VYLTTRPKGVKRFHSALAASDYRYRRTLRKLGTYRMVCTIHTEMRMTVKVTRR
jgi:plastocyanin